jgi:hypothetical protein
MLECLLKYKDFFQPIATMFVGIVAVISWLVNASINRKHHIFQKRLEKRMELFNDMFTLIYLFDGNIGVDLTEITPKLKNLLMYVRLYGDEDEIDKYEEFIKALEVKNLDNIHIIRKELRNLLTCKLRNELECTPVGK